MRLITWNCHGAFARKRPRIEALQPNLLIVPECAHPGEWQPELGTSPPIAMDWVGHAPAHKKPSGQKSRSRGLGVFAYGAYSFTRALFYNPAYRYVLPLEVRGPVSFLLLAVWTTQQDAYTQALMAALWEYEPHLRSGPIVIAGDFNAHVCWEHDRLFFNHVLARLENAWGLSSLYHLFTGKAYGEEEEPTFFFHGHRDKPYHIDYIYANEPLRSRLQRCTIGCYEEWRDLSDHMPVVADFAEG